MRLNLVYTMEWEFRDGKYHCLAFVYIWVSIYGFGGRRPGGVGGGGFRFKFHLMLHDVKTLYWMSIFFL